MAGYLDGFSMECFAPSDRFKRYKVHQSTVGPSRLYAVGNKPVRSLDPAPPSFHERDELRPLHDTVVRRPAHPELQPAFALPVSPVNVPHPLRPSDSHNRHAPARDQHGGGALNRPNPSDVGHADRPAAFRHLLRRERARDLPAEVRDMLELRSERIHAQSVDGLDRGRVQAGRCRERDADVGVRAEGHRWPART